MPDSTVDGRRQGRFANLPRRIYLTYKYRGFTSVLYQTFVFPLRLTPLDRLVRFGSSPTGDAIAARRWYRQHGRPVTVVVPSYRDAELVTRLVAKIRQTTDRDRVRIVVSDDASGPDHVAALHRIGGIDVVAGKHNGGFSVNVNRGLRAADPRHDVVLLNSDVVPLHGWLACLQYAVMRDRSVGIVGAKLLYPDNRIQYAGTVRNILAPEWFDHRYRFRPSDWGPANVGGPTLAATGACMYVRREALDRVGLFDEAYPIGYEDVDYCLRAWQAGFQVAYAPSARLHHHESLTRGTEVGERERRSQHVFWKRWASFFDERNVLTDDGRLRVVYVTENTAVGGGHRVVFEHLNGLADRGHQVELWTLGNEPGWFDLRCPVRRFADFGELQRALLPVHALKIATWWKTALPVWMASVLNGVPVYLVQDIETTYYRDDPRRRDEVLDSYRPEFRFLTTSTWNQARLGELGLEATAIAPGVDRRTFTTLRGTQRRADMVLGLGRSDPLKNVRLTLDAWRRLPQPRPELCLFGSEPELAGEAGIRYVNRPTDEQVNGLLNQATVFVQTSAHEGFCLPILESMATGGAVVCTDAHGNRDFCVDGENCLMPEPRPGAVAASLRRLLGDPELRARLGAAGLATAATYEWPAQIEALERFMYDQARYRPMTSRPDAVPGLR